MTTKPQGTSRLPAPAALMVVAAIVILWTFWIATLPGSAGGGPKKDGVIRTQADIPPEIQAVLKQAEAPTHDRPTPWGLFTINPVVRGAAMVNAQDSPLPQIVARPGAAIAEAAGAGAFATVVSKGGEVLDIPTGFRKGMQPAHVSSRRDGNQSIRSASFFSGDGTAEYLSLFVIAYTPTRAVLFEEFPDNAIRDFRNTFEVEGHPTLVEVPDTGTADPRDERTVAWSQNGSVYLIRTTGLYSDGDVLQLASQISRSEARR